MNRFCKKLVAVGRAVCARAAALGVAGFVALSGSSEALAQAKTTPAKHAIFESAPQTAAAGNVSGGGAAARGVGANFAENLRTKLDGQRAAVATVRRDVVNLTGAFSTGATRLQDALVAYQSTNDKSALLATAAAIVDDTSGALEKITSQRGAIMARAQTTLDDARIVEGTLQKEAQQLEASLAKQKTALISIKVDADNARKAYWNLNGKIDQAKKEELRAIFERSRRAESDGKRDSQLLSIKTAAVKKFGQLANRIEHSNNTLNDSLGQLAIMQHELANASTVLKANQMLAAQLEAFETQVDFDQTAADLQKTMIELRKALDAVNEDCVIDDGGDDPLPVVESDFINWLRESGAPPATGDGVAVK